MDEIVGLLGRDDLVAELVTEIRKGKHVILTGPVGIGKSAVLKAALVKVAAHAAGGLLITLQITRRKASLWKWPGRCWLWA